MYQIDFEKPIHIHFIGIGGISMSGLAEILIEEGFTVSGSDSKESPLTDKLASEGAVIHYGQKAENITDDIQCVVYTAAINKSNPELAETVNRGIPMLTRAELLGQLMKNYDTPIAVSGTHGKTTTTSMLSHILLAGDMDPTISVGGILKAIGGNIRVGASETFLTEACEYTNSFLNFYPKYSVILNSMLKPIRNIPLKKSIMANGRNSPFATLIFAPVTIINEKQTASNNPPHIARLSNIFSLLSQT